MGKRALLLPLPFRLVAVTELGSSQDLLVQMTYAGLHVRDYLRYDFAYTKKHSEWELPILQVKNWACPSTDAGPSWVASPRAAFI